MIYPGSGKVYSHFNTTIPNIKGFSVYLSTSPTASKTLTGITSSDSVLWITGIHIRSNLSGKAARISTPTIACSIGTNLIKVSNGMSGMVVFGGYIDVSA